MFNPTDQQKQQKSSLTKHGLLLVTTVYSIPNNTKEGRQCSITTLVAEEMGNVSE